MKENKQIQKTRLEGRSLPWLNTKLRQAITYRFLRGAAKKRFAGTKKDICAVVKYFCADQITLRLSEMPSLSTHNVRFHFLSEVPLRERSRLKEFVPSIFKREKKQLGDIQYIFCTDDYLLEINKKYLDHDYYTDIITFDLSEPGQPIVAEIYISVERVRDNARSFGTSLKKELHRVMFHGALHLCGYRDKSQQEEKTMRKLEDQYLGLYFPV